MRHDFDLSVWGMIFVIWFWVIAEKLDKIIVLLSK